MATLETSSITLDNNHFRGGANLNKGSRTNVSRYILQEVLNSCMADLTAINSELSAADSPSNTLYVDAGYTGGSSDGSKSRPYTTYTDAAAAASSGDTIKIYPGTFTEDLQLVAGVNVIGLCNPRSDIVSFTGRLIADYSGTCYVKNITCNEDTDDALEVSGTDACILYIRGSRFVVGAGGTYGADITNLNAIVQSWDTEIRSTTGNANATLHVTQGSFQGEQVGIWHEDDTSPGVYETGNGVTTVTFYDYIVQGTVDVDNAVENPNNYWSRGRIVTDNAIAIDTDSENAFYLFDADVHSDNAGDAISGAGLFIYSNVRFTGDSKTIATTLNAGLGPEEDINYDVAIPELRAVRVTGGTLSADGSEDFSVLGSDLLKNQSFASVTIGASLTITAEEPGTPGNLESVEVVDSGGVGGLAISYAAHVLTIDLDGDTPDEDTIAAAINAGASAWTGVLRADSGGGPAFGTVAETPLTGGLGDGLKVYAGGGECSPTGESGGLATSTASYSDTELAVDCVDMTGLTPALQATTDNAQIWLVSNGIKSDTCTVVLA